MKTPDTRQLVGYLTGTVGAAALVSAQHAEAAVVAVNFGFGSVLSSSYGGAGNVGVGSGNGLLGVMGKGPNNIVGLGGFIGSPNGRVGYLYQTTSQNPKNGLPIFFADGAVIGSGGNGALGIGYFNHYSLPNLQFNADQVNKNVAFKTSTNNWGWANVSWDNSAKSLTINSAYVETVPNTSITIQAAAVPEPSRALLALAGLAGVALRRRRKRAA